MAGSKESLMGYAARQPAMTGDEYLVWEAGQTDRHELVDGEVYAMAGAEAGHVTTAGNLYMALRQHLRGTPCMTFISDMKLHVAARDSYFYPDVFVTCAEADRASRLVMREPVLVIEVLSPGTAAFDRGDKFAHYRQIASLQEIALVDIGSRRCDVYRRHGEGEGLWLLHPFEAGEGVTFASVDLRLSAADLFADVDPEPAPRPRPAGSAP